MCLTVAACELSCTALFERSSVGSGVRQRCLKHLPAENKERSGTPVLVWRRGKIDLKCNRSNALCLPLQTKQKTVTREGEDTELRAKGRHDPCVVPRGKVAGNPKFSVATQRFSKPYELGRPSL